MFNNINYKNITNIMPLVILLIIIALIFKGALNLNYTWRWSDALGFLFEVNKDGGLVGGPLWLGLLLTLKITFISIVLATFWAIFLLMLRLSPLWVARQISIFTVFLFRHTPLLVQLYIIYFIIAPLWQWDRITVAILCLVLYQGVYITEVFRSGFLQIKTGTHESSKLLGLSFWQRLRWITLPEILARVSPALINEWIALIKNSAIVSVIAVHELTATSRELVASTFLAFEIWLIVGLCYWIICTLLSMLGNAIERKFSFNE